MFLVIGYGNRLRRDDGAGPELLKMILENGGFNDIRAIEVHQLVPELAEEIALHDVAAVLFFDAGVGTVRPNAQGAGCNVGLSKLDGTTATPSLGHYCDPSTLLLYAELLHGSKPPAWLVTIPGEDFGFGEGFSELTRSSLAVAQEMVFDLLRRLRIGCPSTDARHSPI
jgi:hydrogenase maturation protease